MDSLEGWFPYGEYRPHQREMLDAVALCARKGGILMVDAPTGSGKSSVAAALLAEAGGRKVVIAVRTKSQLATFIRELELIRKKRPSLRFAYLVGKRAMCPMAGDGDPYRRCEGLKAFSSSLMRDRARKGALIPAKDPYILQQIRRQDEEHPLICPYFVRSRAYAETSEGLRMVPSAALRNRAERAARRHIPLSDLREFCGDLCPYELMMQAARGADVILLNFHHLFDEGIREQIFQGLSLETSETLLLVDEAHNCGDVIQSIRSVVLTEAALEQAVGELAHLKKRVGCADALLRITPGIAVFIDSLRRSFKEEDWFDPQIFVKNILSGTLYKSMDEVIDDLLSVEEAVRDQRIEAGDYRETAIEKLNLFLYRMLRSLSDPSFLTVYRRSGEEISLEVRNIDPSDAIKEIAAAHACSVFISGTLSPVDGYRRLYFEDLPVDTMTLPNSFPAENRRIFCTSDITSTYSKRRDEANMSRIAEYIRVFAESPGNCAVYFPSYDFLTMISKRLPGRLGKKEVVAESQDAAESAESLERFLGFPASGKSGILFGVCGGKWSEGLDYRGDLLCGAMVIGLPLAPYSDVRRMVIDYFRAKYGPEGEFLSYTLPAMNKALQALGRVLRTPEDRGILVLGDERFCSSSMKDAMPPWIRDEAFNCTIDLFEEAISEWQ